MSDIRVEYLLECAAATNLPRNLVASFDPKIYLSTPLGCKHPSFHQDFSFLPSTYRPNLSLPPRTNTINKPVAPFFTPIPQPNTNPFPRNSINLFMVVNPMYDNDYKKVIPVTWYLIKVYSP